MLSRNLFEPEFWDFGLLGRAEILRNPSVMGSWPQYGSRCGTFWHSGTPASAVSRLSCPRMANSQCCNALIAARASLTFPRYPRARPCNYFGCTPSFLPILTNGREEPTKVVSKGCVVFCSLVESSSASPKSYGLIKRARSSSARCLTSKMASFWASLPPADPLDDNSTPFLAQSAHHSPNSHDLRPSEDGIDLQSISDSLSDDPAPLLRSASTSGRYPNILPSVVAQRHRQRVPSLLELSILSGPDLSLWERLQNSLHRKCALHTLTRTGRLQCSAILRLRVGRCRTPLCGVGRCPENWACSGAAVCEGGGALSAACCAGQVGQAILPVRGVGLAG